MKRRHLSNQEFFKVCNEVQTHREVVVKECHSKAELAKWLTDRMGFPVSIHAVDNILDTTNVPLERVKKRGKNPDSVHKHRLRVVATAVINLYKSLGVNPPENLVELYKMLNGQLPVNGVPVSSVPDPKTIPIVQK